MNQRHKFQTVEAALQGLKEGGLMGAEAWRTLLERVYQMGYNECLRQQESNQNERTN